MNLTMFMNVCVFKLLCFIVFFTGCDFFTKKAINTGGQHDWIVASDPLKTKYENEFDAIIIGSGIGGLSCASILAKNGYKVLVLEQHSQVGGYCSSYMRDGFSCSVGVEDVSGVYGRGMISNLLKMLNLKADDLFILHTRTYFIGDKKIVITGTKDDFVKQVSKHYPHEKQALQLFFDEAQRACDEFGNQEKSPLSQPTLSKWKSVTYQQKLDKFFKDADLKKLLSSLIGYIGGKPNEVPANVALLGCLRYFIYGGYYPKGGPQHFANALKNFIENNGGTVLTSCKADQIMVANNQVTGVHAGDKIYTSPIVVANVNAKTTFLHLVPKGAIDKDFVDAVAGLKMSKSEIAVTLGVDMDLSHLTSKVDVLDGDKKCDFVVSSNADASLAPRGKATISFSYGAKYEETPEPGTPEYMSYKEEQVQKKIASIEKIIPGLSKHIEVKDILTPRSFERFTSMPEGAIYAFDQSVGDKRPYFKTPLKGLYLASASTGLGGGVEAVAASGFICAQDILEGENMTKSELKTEAIQLPSPSLKSNVSIEGAIKQRKSSRKFSDAPLSISDISQLLWAAQGITHNESLRAAPSAGALYPLELYLVTKNVMDIPAGIYKYNVQKHALEKRREGDFATKLCLQPCVTQAAANIVICGVYERIAKKYADGAQCYTHMEVGCVAENVYLQAVSCGVGTVFVAGFETDVVQKVLDTPATEHPLCIMPLGKIH